MSNTGILYRIMELGMDATDQHMDGYSNFHAKMKLYEILWEAQKQLSMCSTFVGEDEWVAEHAPKEIA